MTEFDNSKPVDRLLDKAQKAIAKSKQLSEHTQEFLQLNDELDEERRNTGQFLLDKFLPVLTAIMGGIAYVLLEHKAHDGWPLNCFRVAGVCLALAILAIFSRAWLEPFFVYNFKVRRLAIKHHQPLPPEIWMVKHFDLIEGVRLFSVLFLVIGGISAAALATMLESGYPAEITSVADTKDLEH